ncbi:SH3 and multiple ankyrin repeat domains protein 3-like [Limulus polyphemus]|uniref:SH3 and multiple ankyrin repeat domains protein 3-like n=1 Tax=Limulus polyphemus TaxID=6850 RepID=A0ABM1SUI1_LIMPO|nr:SH3 and multiple ankyrin repeat domains protein 3-like [Limulus polyphemus]
MKAVAMETADDSSSQTSEGIVNVRVFVPELHLEKCFQFHQDELVWDVKQQVLSSLPKDLNDSVNYGLFMLPKNGKAGKFLDEERLLTEYPLIDTVGYLELRYKRRVSKMMNADDKQNKQLHTRATFRRMIDHVTNGNVDKVSKLCGKGLDPNFHCPESGESPLMLATALPQPAAVLMELVNGGAHLDFRMKDGRTALHRAVERDNYEALKNLLDLGASPNYKDNRGLTALYFSVFYGRDAKLTEILLRDHATFGIADHQGWQEVHQVWN